MNASLRTRQWSRCMQHGRRALGWGGPKSETATNRQHGVKRCRPVRLDRHEAPQVMVPFRRSPARPFVVLPRRRLGVLPLGSP